MARQGDPSENFMLGISLLEIHDKTAHLDPFNLVVLDQHQIRKRRIKYIPADLFDES